MVLEHSATNRTIFRSGRNKPQASEFSSGTDQVDRSGPEKPLGARGAVKADKIGAAQG